MLNAGDFPTAAGGQVPGKGDQPGSDRAFRKKRLKKRGSRGRPLAKGKARKAFKSAGKLAGKPFHQRVLDGMLGGY